MPEDSAHHYLQAKYLNMTIDYYTNNKEGKMKNLRNDKRGFWPYSVAAAIFLIVGFVLGVLVGRGILPGQSLICP